MLKIPAKDFMQAVDAVRSIWGKAKSEKIRDQENLIRREGVHRRLIRDFYNSTNHNSHFRQYTIMVSNQRYSSTIFTTPQRVRLSIPLKSLETKYISSASEPKYNKRLTKIIKKRAANVRKKFELLGVQPWDQDIFRLVSDPFWGESPRLSFSVDRYLNYQFTVGLLDHELFDCLISNKNDIPAILRARAVNLPIRNELLPTKISFKDVSERLSTGGVACTVAMARGAPDNDYCIPLQERSESVAEGRGVFTGSIQAWHQPNVRDYKNEVNLYWTVLRELFEEVYQGKEIIKETSHLRHDWYLKECPGVAYIHEQPENVTFEFLGIGINALLGTYDCAILLAIHDTSYWDAYSHLIRPNWEAKRGFFLSTKDVMPSLNNIFNSGWYDQGMFGLSQGLLRLRELDEKRVKDLDIGFALD
jgi:hypothetical protein